MLGACFYINPDWPFAHLLLLKRSAVSQCSLIQVVDRGLHLGTGGLSDTLNIPGLRVYIVPCDGGGGLMSGPCVFF